MEEEEEVVVVVLAVLDGAVMVLDMSSSAHGAGWNSYVG